MLGYTSDDLLVASELKFFVVCRWWSGSSPCYQTACGKLPSLRQNTQSRSKKRFRNSNSRCGNQPLSSTNFSSSMLFVWVTDTLLNLQGEAEEEDENLPVQEVSFDPEKAQCCVVENGQGLTHGSGGKGYGLASTGISSGCYQWKVKCWGPLCSHHGKILCRLMVLNVCCVRGVQNTVYFHCPVLAYFLFLVGSQFASMNAFFFSV